MDGEDAANDEGVVNAAALRVSNETYQPAGALKAHVSTTGAPTAWIHTKHLEASATD